MNNIVVYTCITGGYDNLKELSVKNPLIDYICFTDDILLKSDTWKVIYIKDMFNIGCVRLQRYYKMHPHIFLRGYDISIWVDGNIEIRTDLSELLSELNFNEYNIFIHKHPEHDCIYKECNLLKLINPVKYTDILNKQIIKYKNEKFPEHYGLTQTNIIIRKHNEYSCMMLMELWWHELTKYSHRDQTCLSYCLWKMSYSKLYTFPPILNHKHGDTNELHITRDFQYRWAHDKNTKCNK